MQDAYDFIKMLRYDDGVTFSKLKSSVFPIIIKFLRNNNGTIEEAEDIFNAAILVLLESSKAITQWDNFLAYFIKICRNKWIDELNSKTKIVKINDFAIDNLADTPYNPTKDKQSQMLYSAIENLDLRSQQVIQLLLKGKSNTEIAAIMGFKNTQAVADKKKSCMKKLKRDLDNYKELQDE